MKILGSLLFLLSCLTVRADGLALAAGDVYVFTFNSLVLTLPSVGGAPAAVFTVAFNSDLMTAGEAIRVEMFENSITDVPFGMNVFMGVGSPPAGLVAASSSVATLVPTYWQDRQGTVRLTMLTGSANVTRLDFSTDIGNNTRYYQSFPVPEPAPAALLALGGWILGWRRCRRTNCR